MATSSWLDTVRNGLGNVFTSRPAGPIDPGFNIDRTPAKFLANVPTYTTRYPAYNQPNPGLGTIGSTYPLTGDTRTADQFTRPTSPNPWQLTSPVTSFPTSPSVLGPNRPTAAATTIPPTKVTNPVTKGGATTNTGPEPTPETQSNADVISMLSDYRTGLEKQNNTSTTTTPSEPIAPTKYTPLTIEQINGLLDKARTGAGFLSEQDIQSLEDTRKNKIFDIINNSYNQQAANATREGNQLIKGTGALYTNLAGGSANATSGTVEAVRNEMRTLDKNIADLEQKRLDDISKEDILSAQRVEDRINQLTQRKNELDTNTRANITTAEQSKQFGASEDQKAFEFSKTYGIDLGKLDVEHQKLTQDALKLSKSDALDAAKFLIQNFGSAATDGMNLGEILALEMRAGLPTGSLMRQLQTIDEQKANQLQFQAGTKYEQPGSFNPNTGEFKTINSAARYIDESGGASDKKTFADLPSDQQQALLTEYENAPDKDKFLTQVQSSLGKGIAGDLLIGGGLSAYRDQPDDATNFAQVAHDVKQAFIDDPSGMTVDKAKKYFAAKGLAETDKDGKPTPVAEFLKNYAPKPWWQITK